MDAYDRATAKALLQQHSGAWLVPDPPSLTVQQQFRLIEIAHETSNLALREAAMRLLHEVQNPVQLVTAGGGDA